MVAGKPAIDPIAVYDPETCECVLAEDYKRAIREAIPPGIEPLDAFWRELTDVISKFFIMQKCRAVRPPPAAEIKRWETIARLATTEGHQNTTRTAVKDLAEARLAALRTIQWDFSRKKNPNNEALYFWILEDLWCRGLGQELGVSSVKKEMPGPLIRFFAACVNPLLTEPLTAHAIVSIRNRVRDRREKHGKTHEKLGARKRIKTK
jgi:hypothetical protein